MRHSYKLKGSNFGIDRDYPHEIASARGELYRSDAAKRARVQRLKVQIKYPAQLYIQGKLIEDKFPDWSRLVNAHRITSLKARANAHNVNHVQQ